MTELIIAEKRTGNMWECSKNTKEISYTTNRTGTPGTLKFTVLKAADLSFVEGDIVRFSVDGILVFFGWVFTKSKNRWGEIEVTCYDRLRYLKGTASYSFYDMSAADIIKQIAEDLQLDISELEDTGYQIPSLIESEQTYLDIIGDAINQTLLNTGKVFVFYDDGNGLCLKEAVNLMSNVMIGDKSLLNDYTYKTDIDQQTYNSVKLGKQNEDTGTVEIYIAQDGENIGKWGLLQLYQSVDGDMNEAQIKEQAQAMLKYYNRRMRTLSVESLGVLGLRAGSMVLMQVENLGDINLNQLLLLEKVTHTWENDRHTMSFDTLAF